MYIAWASFCNGKLRSSTVIIDDNETQDILYSKNTRYYTTTAAHSVLLKLNSLRQCVLHHFRERMLRLRPSVSPRNGQRSPTSQNHS